MQEMAREQWQSRLGFVLAAVGSAVGLGNVWKFPYMIGQNGGSAFVLVYLLCILLIGFPILVAEWLIGRRGQKNPVNTMTEVALKEGQSASWGVVGAMGVLAAFLILSFYSIIGGWALKYIGSTATGAFTGLDGAATGAIFDTFLADFNGLLLWHSLFMLATMAIVALGVSWGLELASKWLMPALFVILVFIVGYGAVYGDFAQAARYMFTPNWSLINADVVLAALGHAFFTLSLGMGIMLAYGSFLGREVNLLKTAGIVLGLDTFIAILAGLAIFPIVFGNQLTPSAGPGLIFISLPIAFGALPAGALIGGLFFVLLSFAALTSAISLLEPVVELLEERTRLKRIQATVIAGLVIWGVGIASILSFNHWSDIKLIKGMGVFDTLDYLTSKFMLPLTGLAIIIFTGWFMRQEAVREDLELSVSGFKLWQILARFIAPVALLIVFLHGVGLFGS